MSEAVSTQELEQLTYLESGNNAALDELVQEGVDAAGGPEDGEDPEFDSGEPNSILVTDPTRNHVIAVGVGNPVLNRWYLENSWYANRVLPVKIGWRAGEWLVSGVSPTLERGFVSRLPSLHRLGRVVFNYFQH